MDRPEIDWRPIDTTQILEQHINGRRIPATFEPYGAKFKFKCPILMIPDVKFYRFQMQKIATRVRLTGRKVNESRLRV